jgi:hypothetical protein
MGRSPSLCIGSVLFRMRCPPSLILVMSTLSIRSEPCLSPSAICFAVGSAVLRVDSHCLITMRRNPKTVLESKFGFVCFSVLSGSSSPCTFRISMSVHCLLESTTRLAAACSPVTALLLPIERLKMLGLATASTSPRGRI